MDVYSAKNAAIASYLGAASGLNAANSVTKAPDTIASAVGGLDRLNERLNSLAAAAYQISNTIGAPSPLVGCAVGPDTPEPMGHVHRLNTAASRAHEKLNEIEEVLSAIQRALG